MFQHWPASPSATKLSMKYGSLPVAALGGPDALQRWTWTSCATVPVLGSVGCSATQPIKPPPIAPIICHLSLIAVLLRHHRRVHRDTVSGHQDWTQLASIGLDGNSGLQS